MMFTIQFGQCGNQLGHSLFSKISSDIACTNTGVPYNRNYEYAENAFNKWFTTVNKNGIRLARAILIDTEQKVVTKVCNNTSAHWTYSTENVICQTGGGSANNWSFGYTTKGPQLRDVVLNVVRRELERMDYFDGFLMLLSSAGGTGSGVGSYITELLREEYKSKSIVGSVVLPFPFGEVGTQSYNTLLTLAKLSNQTDAIFLFRNEQIHNICTDLLKKTETKLQDINEIISEKLAAVFQPINNPRSDMNLLVSQIASHPCYKFGTIKTTPQDAATSYIYESVYKWQSYVQHLKQTLRISSSKLELGDKETRMPSSVANDTQYHNYSCCVSNVLFTRGTRTGEDSIATGELQEQRLYTSWATHPFAHFHQDRRILNKEKFLALLTNNSQIYHPLNAFVDKAWNLYTHAAFLHRYKKFGIEEDDFLQAFARVENIVNDYKNLNNNVLK